MLSGTDKEATGPSAPQRLVNLDFVTDGPPGPNGGRFVELEVDGRRVNPGKWIKREDGYWSLRVAVILPEGTEWTTEP